MTLTDRCESCDDTGIYEEGDEWTPCQECELGHNLVPYFKAARREGAKEERERWVAYLDRLRAEAREERNRRAPEFPKAERLEREAGVISAALAALEEADRG